MFLHRSCTYLLRVYFWGAWLSYSMISFFLSYWKHSSIYKWLCVLLQARFRQRVRRWRVGRRRAGPAVGARVIQRRRRHGGEPRAQPAARREHARRRELVLHTGTSLCYISKSSTSTIMWSIFGNDPDHHNLYIPPKKIFFRFEITRQPDYNVLRPIWVTIQRNVRNSLYSTANSCAVMRNKLWVKSSL